jgi:hypothetical protein
MWSRERTTRTERRVVVTSDVTFCAGYHYRLVYPVDEAVDVYTFEGITVLCMVMTDLSKFWTTGHGAPRYDTVGITGLRGWLITVPYLFAVVW